MTIYYMYLNVYDKYSSSNQLIIFLYFYIVIDLRARRNYAYNCTDTAVICGTNV